MSKFRKVDLYNVEAMQQTLDYLDKLKEEHDLKKAAAANEHLMEMAKEKIEAKEKIKAELKKGKPLPITDYKTFVPNFGSTKKPNIGDLLEKYRHSILADKSQRCLDDFLTEINYPEDKEIDVYEIDDIEYTNGRLEIIFRDEYNNQSRPNYIQKGKVVSNRHGVQLTERKASEPAVDTGADTIGPGLSHYTIVWDSHTTISGGESTGTSDSSQF